MSSMCHKNIVPRFIFTPVPKGFRSLIHTWLAEAHVREWFYGEGLKKTLEDLDAFFLGSSLFQHWLASDQGVPFGYLLTSKVREDERDEYSRFCSFEGDAITLDVLIGNRDYLGKGLAHHMIQRFLETQFPDVQTVFIDPEVLNTKAIHVYQKAGFSIVDQFIPSHSVKPHYMMKFHKQKLSKHYQIIHLNGPSSSGKSTIAKALQEAFDVPFLHIGIDIVIEMMPKKLNNLEGGSAPDGFSWRGSSDERGLQMQELQMGPFAEKMCSTFKELVLTLAKLGHYIIIDDVSLIKKEIESWKQLLKEYKVLWVGVNAPLSLLEERESRREDRIKGSARAQYFKVHSGIQYDLDCDTSLEALEDIVATIKRRIDG